MNGLFDLVLAESLGNTDSTIYMVADLWPGEFEGFEEPYVDDTDSEDLTSLEGFMNPDHLWVDSLVERPDEEWVQVLKSQYGDLFENIRIIDKSIKYHKPSGSGNFESQKDEPLQDDRGSNPLCRLAFVADVGLFDMLRELTRYGSWSDVDSLIKQGDLRIVKSSVGEPEDLVAAIEKLAANSRIGQK